ncbi:hypothetical protein PRK78_004966 [Emydomyces testavorans]|uniref:Uncharacterized protein n=1 Tax=Emydomyces testavorans TaxID=2070801 RepID=A0AAF0DIY7_9EURO|nr:hypothetical protein PRK78_004966 [Emydomyces testavorans]
MCRNYLLGTLLISNNADDDDDDEDGDDDDETRSSRPSPDFKLSSLNLAKSTHISLLSGGNAKLSPTFDKD